MDKSWAGQWSHPHNTQDSLSGSCAAEATRLQQGQQYLPSLPSSPPSHTPQDFMSKSGCPRCGGPAQFLPPTLAECPDLLWSLCVTSGRLKSVKEVLHYSGPDLQRLTSLPSHDVQHLLRAASLHVRGSRVLTGGHLGYRLGCLGRRPG